MVVVAVVVVVLLEGLPLEVAVAAITTSAAATSTLAAADATVKSATAVVVVPSTHSTRSLPDVRGSRFKRHWSPSIVLHIAPKIYPTAFVRHL